MLELTNTTKQHFPLSVELLEKIASDILSTSYDVSIVIVGDKKALSLNKTYRDKDYIPNVLSFPIDETMGEIFLNQKKSKLEASKFNMTTNHYLYYLLIHSFLHLTNLDHGDEMTSHEIKYMQKYFDIDISELF